MDMRSIWELDVENMISPELKKLYAEHKDTFEKMGINEKEFERQVYAGADAVKHKSEALKEQKDMLGEAGKMMLEFFAVEKIMDWGKEWLSAGMAVDKYQTQFGSLLHDVKAGKEAYEEINKVKADFPILDKKALMDAGMMLEKAGVPVDKLHDKLRRMSAVAMGDPAKINELAFAYERANAMGMVQSRQLLAQPELLKEIGRMHGYTGKALQKFLAEGAVGVADLNKAFINLTTGSGMFATTLEDQANTLEGKWTKAMFTIEEESLKLYEDMKPFMIQMADFGTKYLPEIIEGIKDFNNWTGYIDGVKNEFKDLWTIGSDVVDVFQTIRDLGKDWPMMAEAWHMVGQAVGGALNPFSNLLHLTTAGLENLKGLKDWFIDAKNWLLDFFNTVIQKATGVAEIQLGLATQNFALIQKGRNDFMANGTHFYEDGKEVRETKKREAKHFSDLQQDIAAAGGPSAPGPYIFGSEQTEIEKKYGKSSPYAGGTDETGSSSSGGGSGSSGFGKTIIQHIAKLGGDVHIHVHELKESNAQVRDNYIKLLLGVTNDAQTAI